MKFYLIIVVLLAIGVPCFSQSNTQFTTDKVKEKAQPGSYQFIFLIENPKPISLDRPLLEKIQEERMTDKEKYLTINAELIVRILSFNQLQNGIYITSEEEYIIDPNFEKH